MEEKKVIPISEYKALADAQAQKFIKMSLTSDFDKASRSPHLYPATLFAVCSGAHKGEILGLKWRDVDFDRQTATFRDTKNGNNRNLQTNSVSPYPRISL